MAANVKVVSVVATVDVDHGDGRVSSAQYRLDPEEKGVKAAIDKAMKGDPSEYSERVFLQPQPVEDRGKEELSE